MTEIDNHDPENGFDSEHRQAHDAGSDAETPVDRTDAPSQLAKDAADEAVAPEG